MDELFQPTPSEADLRVGRGPYVPARGIDNQGTDPFGLAPYQPPNTMVGANQIANDWILRRDMSEASPAQHNLRYPQSAEALHIANVVRALTARR